MSGASTDRHAVARTDELADGERLVTQTEGREIAIFYQMGRTTPT